MVSATHYLPVDVSLGRKSRAYFSVDPNGTAIVFVHGFRGQAVATWSRFPPMLLEQEVSRRSDLIFFGYNSTNQRARISAIEFRRFLHSMFSDPRSIATEPITQSRSQSFAYSRVLIVAHSLGAVVARQAMIEGRRASCAWLDKISLVLFAPADTGASAIPLVESTLIFLMLPGLLRGPLTALCPILQDLEEGCQTLRALLEDCQVAIKAGSSDYLVARKVIHGVKDRVVNPTRFAEDPEPICVPDMGHTQVCRPSKTYGLPIREVIASI